MSNIWVLDILKDLRTFASQNGLSRLAEQLDDTLLVAAEEIKAHNKGAKLQRLGGHEPTVRILLGESAGGKFP